MASRGEDTPAASSDGQDRTTDTSTAATGAHAIPSSARRVNFEGDATAPPPPAASAAMASNQLQQLMTMAGVTNFEALVASMQLSGGTATGTTQPGSTGASAGNTTTGHDTGGDTDTDILEVFASTPFLSAIYQAALAQREMAVDCPLIDSLANFDHTVPPSAAATRIDEYTRTQEQLTGLLVKCADGLMVLLGCRFDAKTDFNPRGTDQIWGLHRSGNRFGIIGVNDTAAVPERGFKVPDLEKLLDASTAEAFLSLPAGRSTTRRFRATCLIPACLLLALAKHEDGLSFGEAGVHIATVIKDLDSHAGDTSYYREKLGYALQWLWAASGESTRRIKHVSANTTTIPAAVRHQGQIVQRWFPDLLVSSPSARSPGTRREDSSRPGSAPPTAPGSGAAGFHTPASSSGTTSGTAHSQLPSPGTYVRQQMQTTATINSLIQHMTFQQQQASTPKAPPPPPTGDGSTSKKKFELTWSAAAQRAIINATAPYPADTFDANNDDISGQRRSEPTELLRRVVEANTIQQAADELLSHVREQSQVELQFAISSVASLIAGKIMNTDTNPGLVTVFNLVRPDNASLQDVDLAYDPHGDELQAMITARYGRGMTDSQAKRQSQPVWYTPKTINEAYVGANDYAALWRALTSDGDLHSPLHDFWLQIGTWINVNRAALTTRACRLPRLPTEILGIAQRYQDSFLLSCSRTGPDGHPDESILSGMQTFQDQVLIGLAQSVVLPEYIEQLYHKRQTGRGDGPKPGGGGGGGDGGGGKIAKRKKGRDDDDSPDGDGESSSKKQRAKRRGSKVTNPGRRDTDTAAKCLQKWALFLRQMPEEWPEGCNCTDISQSVCLNYHVRGVCYDTCQRSHAALPDAKWSKLWAACKNCCA